MPWLASVGNNTGGGAGGTTIDPELLASLQKIANPNLLYNSTGMMNMGGWVVHPKSFNFRDPFIIDDFSYFVTKGNDEGTGMVSASMPLLPNTVYTFSGEFASIHPVRISMLYQDANGLNSYTNLIEAAVLFEGVLNHDEANRKVLHFTPPTGTVSASLRLEHLSPNETDQAVYKRLKIEKGSKATAWVPCMTDPYQNNVVITGMTAADMA